MPEGRRSLKRKTQVPSFFRVLSKCAVTFHSSYFSTQNHFHGIEQGGRGRDSRLKGLEFESLLKEDGVSVIFDWFSAQRNHQLAKQQKNKDTQISKWYFDADQGSQCWHLPSLPWQTYTWIILPGFKLRTIYFGCSKRPSISVPLVPVVCEHETFGLGHVCNRNTPSFYSFVSVGGLANEHDGQRKQLPRVAAATVFTDQIKIEAGI